MYTNAADGPLGIKAMAHLNPFRWSGPVSLEKCISDIEEAVELYGEKWKFTVKLPANTMKAAGEGKTAAEAVALIRDAQNLKTFYPGTT